MGKGSDIGLLDDVLGFSIVAHHPASDAIEPLIMGLHDDAEGVAFACQRAAHEKHLA